MAKRGNKPVIWCERENYDAIKRLMPDEQNLCDTFEQWLDKTNKDIKKFESLSFVVRKTDIDVKEFTAHCVKARQDYNRHTIIDRRNYERGK